MKWLLGSVESETKLCEILDFFKVSYNKQTENTINISCPYCEDTGNHCGIFLDGWNFNCWKCGASGTLYNFLRDEYNLTYDKYIEMMKTATSTEEEKSPVESIAAILEKPKEGKKDKNKKVSWPPPGCVPISQLSNDLFVHKFIESRNCDLPFCIEKDVYIGLTSKNVGRFVIPVIEKGVVVAYQGRDMTNRSRSKYLSEGAMSNYLYEIDAIQEDSLVAVVEGIFDCWGTPNSVATFGTSFSIVQISKLLKKNPKEVVLAWDISEDGSDAYWKMRKLKDTISAAFSVVSYVELPKDKDPGDLGMVQMENIIKKRVVLQ